MGILTDIAPMTENVVVGGKSITVRGLSVAQIATAAQRWPELMAAVDGKGMSPSKIIMELPGAATFVILCGIGAESDATEEAAANGLALEHQFDLVEAVLHATLPRGAAPFVERARALVGLAPDRSQTSSPKVSPISSTRDTAKIASGA